MRRTLTALLLTLGFVGVCAQPFDPFQPENPIVMGRGGSYTATATGYNSFFYNPWNWGFIPLHLSSRGWKLLDYDPPNEALLSSPDGGRLLRLVSHQRRTSTTDIGGNIIDLGEMLLQPDNITNILSASQKEMEAVLGVIEEIGDSGCSPSAIVGQTERQK